MEEFFDNGKHIFYADMHLSELRMILKSKNNCL